MIPGLHGIFQVAALDWQHLLIVYGLALLIYRYTGLKLIRVDEFNFISLLAALSFGERCRWQIVCIKEIME